MTEVANAGTFFGVMLFDADACGLLDWWASHRREPLTVPLGGAPLFRAGNAERVAIGP
jgi:hypothetical protein